jgi:hypothetical protein
MPNAMPVMIWCVVCRAWLRLPTNRERFWTAFESLVADAAILHIELLKFEREWM